MRKQKLLSPLKSIRAKCLDCSCWQPKEIKLCPLVECSLYPFRFGKNPNRAGIGHPSKPFLRKTHAELRNFSKEGGSNGA